MSLLVGNNPCKESMALCRVLAAYKATTKIQRCLCRLTPEAVSHLRYMTACSTGNHYTVKLNDDRHTCRCVDFCCRGRQRPCKHLTLVMQQLGMTSDNPKGWHQVRQLTALTWAFLVSPCDAAAGYVRNDNSE